MPRLEVVRALVSYHPITNAFLWRRPTEVGLSVDHPRFTTVRFEDLTVDSEGVVSRLCDFVGLQFQPAMLDVPQIRFVPFGRLGRATRNSG